MRSNMTYYSLDKAAYEARYWTIQEKQPNDEAAQGSEADDGVSEKGGNDSRDKGVAIPDEGGNDSGLKGVTIPEKGGSHSVKGGNGYREKGVTATPIYRREEAVEEADEEEREKERKTEPNLSLPASLPASLFSEVMESKAWVNPFSQPMFAGDPDRPAQRQRRKL